MKKNVKKMAGSTLNFLSNPDHHYSHLSDFIIPHKLKVSYNSNHSHSMDFGSRLKGDKKVAFLGCVSWCLG